MLGPRVQATQWTRRTGDASAGYASNGVEFVEAEVRKHSGE